MSRRHTKKQTFAGYAEVINAIREDRKPDTGRKDGSIGTTPIVPVPDLPEAEVLKQVLHWCKTRRLAVDRLNNGAFEVSPGKFYRYGITGAGDIMGMFADGTHLEIEAKRGRGGSLSVDQQKRKEVVEKNNGVYMIVHGIAELEAIMEKYYGKFPQ